MYSLKQLAQLSKSELKQIKKELLFINEKKSHDTIMQINNLLRINEDDGGGGAAMASASTAGMGAVVSAQPCALSGVTTGAGFANSGGTVGSGDYGKPLGNQIATKLPKMKFVLNRKQHKKKKK